MGACAGMALKGARVSARVRMTPERWSRVKEIFRAALECSGAAREVLVRERCVGDAELLEELTSLLGELEHTQGFLKHGPLDDPRAIARRVLDKEPGAEPIPERIAGFRIERVLGRGGMGVVYLAQQDQPRRSVALKVLSASVFSPRARRRFEHEVEVLGRLQHPGIAQIHEAGTFVSDGLELP